ncbi:phospholipid carrier-dependent glycosyltransferase [Candidatus Collierbacteria bacterium]|nr:phospholipid carrier-dependent glycosyltransferase [Candidatus Collierbacteria bacterium]
MRNEPTLRFLPQSDGKQPLFMWLTIPALKLIEDPLIAGRLVSVMAGLGSLFAIAVLTFVLTKNLFLASLSALIYAVTPFSVFFDRLSLVDSLLSFFGLASLVFGYLLVTRPRLDLAMLLGFALGGGLLTKTPALIFYLWQIILALFYFRPNPKNFKTDGFKLLGGWITALIISQAMYAVLRLGPNFHLINFRNQDYVFSVAEVLRHPLNPLIGNLKTSFNWLVSLFTPSLFLLLPLALLKNKRLTLFLTSVSLLPLLAQAFVIKAYTSRYILYAAIPLLILSAQGLSALSIKIKGKAFYLLYLLVFSWPFFLSLKYVFTPEKVNMPGDMRYGYLGGWTAGWGQKQVAEYLIDLAKQGKKIVVVTEGYFGTLPDGLQIYTQKYPRITVIGSPQPVFSLPESLLNTSKENEIFLLLNRSRNLLKANELERLTLVASYPKPPRPDGSREFLDFYSFE